MSRSVVVIGAGAAGLAAAAELSCNGLNVTVLEARNRIGGRIHTIRRSDSVFPIELGAEFIHGKPPEILDIATQYGSLFVDVPTRHWFLRNGIFHDTGDFFSGLNKIMERIKRTDKSDISLEEFMDTKIKTSLRKEAKAIVRLYTQGFHAAETNRISIQSLKKMAAASDKIDGDRQFRFLEGYGRFSQHFYDQALQHGATFQFNRIVKEIHWNKNSVDAIATCGNETNEFHASRALITLPLPILQKRTVRFFPPLPEKEKAADHIAMGDTVKVNFIFRERFWENLKVRFDNGRHSLSDFTFIHASEEMIPTWWTQLPIRVPILVGWTGGPNATRLLQQGLDVVFDRAMNSLHKILKVPRNEIEDLLEESYVHDWAADLFSQGAYSYVPIGGLRAPAQLARPVEDTLFFAGEATNTEGHTGTVHGAIATGIRASREMVAKSGG